MEYLKSSKKGATVTVFAPYDCKNKCPFCINKKDYAKQEYNIEKVKESIQIMSIITPNCDFVITGGEPLADIPSFLELVNLIKSHGNHNLYVNTTLPIEHKDIEILNQYKDKINCINISRHLEKYVEECPDNWIGELKIPIRINCVLYSKKNIEKSKEFVNRFLKFNNIVGIQFRDNYIGVNCDNLYEISDVLEELYKIFDNVEYGIHKDIFRYNVILSEKVNFHRTQCYSKIINGDKIFIGDIIINIQGDIMDDWNEYGSPLNIEGYRKAKLYGRIG